MDPNKVIPLPRPVKDGEAAPVLNSSPGGSQPVSVQPAPREHAASVVTRAEKPDAAVSGARDPLAALKVIVDASRATPDVQAAPVPDVKVTPRETSALPAKRSRGRKLRVITSLGVVLIVGWLVTVHSSSTDLSTARIWLHQGSDLLSSSLLAAKAELQGHFEHLIRSDAATLQADQSPPPAVVSPGEAIERTAQTLTLKLDQMQALSEGATRDVQDELERLKVAIERSQADLTSRLAQVVERIERMEQSKVSAPPAAATPRSEQVVASSAASTPPPAPRPVPVSDAKPVSPAAAEARREPSVVRQWTVREVLNGMALLEGPRGLVGVSPGQTVPGIGRVESILRQGNQWVVATSGGVIRGRVGLQ